MEEAEVQGETAGIVARIETATDVRARHKFNDEYHHFSESVANVLVINVSGVIDGMKAWPSEIARLLQPSRNRKVGAVVFFDQASVGPPEAIRRKWRVLVNPFAHMQIPKTLLDGLESLDESTDWGTASSPRPAP